MCDGLPHGGREYADHNTEDDVLHGPFSLQNCLSTRMLRLEIDLHAKLEQACRHNLRRLQPLRAHLLLHVEDRVRIQRIVDIEVSLYAALAGTEDLAQTKVELVDSSVERVPEGLQEIDRDCPDVPGERAAKRRRDLGGCDRIDCPAAVTGGGSTTDARGAGRAANSRPC